MMHSIWHGGMVFNISRDGTLLKDYIEFIHGYGCHSLVGRDGKRQYIVLSPYCAEEHTLIHEVASIHHWETTLR